MAGAAGGEPGGQGEPGSEAEPGPGAGAGPGSEAEPGPGAGAGAGPGGEAGPGAEPGPGGEAGPGGEGEPGAGAGPGGEGEPGAGAGPGGEGEPGAGAGAGPGGEGEPGAGAESERLDVTSEHFDPYLALYSPREPRLPFPLARCFNNLAEYESVMLRGRGSGPVPIPAAGTRPRARVRQRRGARPPPDPERIDRLRKLMVREDPEREPRPRRQRNPKNLLTRMSLYEGSPLGELHRCVQDRIKINVHIRTFKGLRGVCSGFLVAFDKFWNIALVDVDETFRKPILGKAFYHEPALTITRLFEKLKLQQKLEEQENSPKQSDSSLKTPEDFPSAQQGESGSLEVVQATPTEVNPNSLNFSVKNEVAESDLSKRRSEKVASTCTGAKQRRNKSSKAKVDYQKVSQRHVNQLFIRGENILLINLLE